MGRADDLQSKARGLAWPTTLGTGQLELSPQRASAALELLLRLC